MNEELITLKGKVLRTIRSERTMLQDALAALKNDKPHVTIDHIERVIDALDKLETETKVKVCDHDYQDVYDNGEQLCTFCGDNPNY